MKHFTSFATTLLLWLCAAVAWADGITVADSYTPVSELTDGYYLLKTRIKGTNGYIYRKSGDTNRPMRQKPEASMNLTNIGLEYVWYITNTNGVLIFQNASTGEYFPAHKGDGGDMTDDKTSSSNAAMLKSANFTPYTNSLDGGVLLYQANFSTYIHANTTDEHNLSYWTGGTVGDGQSNSIVQFAFYKLSGVTSSVVTPTYAACSVIKRNGELIASNVWSAGLKGTAIPSPTKSYYYSLENSDQVIYGPNSGSVEQNYVATAPSGITFSTPENPVWYVLRTRSNNNGNTVVYTDDSNILTGSHDSHNSYYSTIDYKLLKGAHWALVESGLGVKLYNHEAKKYVTVSNKDNKATMTDAGTTFYMQTSDNADFSLQYENTWGYLGDHQTGCLGTWSHKNDEGAQNDGGSGFKVKAVDNTDFTTAQGIFANLPGATDDVLPLNTQANVENIKAKAASATDWAGLDAAYAGLNWVLQPDPNAYYRIRNVNADLTNRYLSTEAMVVGIDGVLNTNYESTNNRRIGRKSDADNFTSEVWQFVSNGNGYYGFRNVNTNCMFGQTNGTNPVEMPIANAGSGSYTFKPYNSSAPFDGYNANTMMLMIRDNGDQVSAKNGNDDAYVCINNNQYTNKSNYWQLVKVTSVPVTIKNVGWASVAFPFAVKVPTESGVKAYIAETAEGSVMKLKEIEDGIIPANTGALLAKDGGTTVNLELTTTTTTYPENKLQYTTAERKGYATNTIVNYLLSAKSGTVGFLPSKLDFVPSNKAFLPATNITAATADAQMLTFNFGEITGISHATTNQDTEAEVYYDLNGRRVMYPSNGIFVTAQGKKIFIK